MFDSSRHKALFLGLLASLACGSGCGPVVETPVAMQSSPRLAVMAGGHTPQREIADVEREVDWLTREVTAADQNSRLLAEMRKKLLAEKEQLEREVADLKKRAYLGEIVWQDGERSRLVDVEFEYRFRAHGDPRSRMIDTGPLQRVRARSLHLKTVTHDLSVPRMIPLRDLSGLAVEDDQLKVVTKSGEVLFPALIDFESLGSSAFVFVHRPTATFSVRVTTEELTTYSWFVLEKSEPSPKMSEVVSINLVGSALSGGER
jgi:hypothetical protein